LVDSISSTDPLQLGYAPEGADPAIVLAVKSGKVDAVVALLSGGMKIRPTSDGVPLLHYAVQSETPSSEIVDVLLDFGVDVDQQDSMGRTALQCALLSRNVGLVELLLGRNADISLKDYEGKGLAETFTFITQMYGENDVLFELLANSGVLDSVREGSASETSRAVYVLDEAGDVDDAEDVDADSIALEFARTAAAQLEADRVRAEEDAEFDAILQAEAEEEEEEAIALEFARTAELQAETDRYTKMLVDQEARAQTAQKQLDAQAQALAKTNELNRLLAHREAEAEAQRQALAIQQAEIEAETEKLNRMLEQRNAQPVVQPTRFVPPPVPADRAPPAERPQPEVKPFKADYSTIRATLCIQRAFRAFKAKLVAEQEVYSQLLERRKKQKVAREQEAAAALAIQNAVRGYLARANYQQMLAQRKEDLEFARLMDEDAEYEAILQAEAEEEEAAAEARAKEPKEPEEVEATVKAVNPSNGNYISSEDPGLSPVNIRGDEENYGGFPEFEVVAPDPDLSPEVMHAMAELKAAKILAEAKLVHAQAEVESIRLIAEAKIATMSQQSAQQQQQQESQQPPQPASPSSQATDRSWGSAPPFGYPGFPGHHGYDYPPHPYHYYGAAPPPPPPPAGPRGVPNEPRPAVPAWPPMMTMGSGPSSPTFFDPRSVSGMVSSVGSANFYAAHSQMPEPVLVHNAWPIAGAQQAASSWLQQTAPAPPITSDTTDSDDDFDSYF